MSILQSSSDTSTNIGVRPARTMASEVAKKEKAGTITSFLVKFRDSKAIVNASVPLPTEITFLALRKFAALKLDHPERGKASKIRYSKNTL